MAEILLFDLVFHDRVTSVSVSTLKPLLGVIGAILLKPEHLRHLISLDTYKLCSLDFHSGNIFQWEFYMVFKQYLYLWRHLEERLVLAVM